MYFGNGIGDSWLAMFATHPPIEERIQEIAPGFDIAAAKAKAPVPAATPKKQDRIGGRLAEALLPGQPRVAEAAALLAGLPDGAKSACRELHGACALVYSLLLPDEEKSRERAIALIDADDTLRAEILSHYERRAGLNSAQRLGLVDIAIPTLRHLSHGQYAVFRSNVKKLVEADGEIQLFEYTLQKILVRHLDLYFSNATGTKVVYKSLIPLLPEAGILLSVLASVDPGTDEHKEAAFRSGVSELLVKPSAFPLDRAAVIDLPGFDAALDKIAMAAPDVKRTILTACGAVVMHDGEVNDNEVEFLRAISDTLDCPVPPFVRIA